MTSEQQRLAAIIVPLSTRPELTAQEQIALAHLRRFLGHYPIFLVAPPAFPVPVSGMRVVRFPKRFFGSGAAHARLMLSRGFYRRFQQYEYILIYHLDALVFSDQLAAWCAAGYDYIGAPWFRDPARPELGFTSVGNGGFSLRRVGSFLKVLASPRHTIDPATYRRSWEETFSGRSLPVRLLNTPRLLLKRLLHFNGVRHFINGYALNEDHFWADEARYYYPELKIAPPEIALRFAFELAPRYSYELIGQQLPFGCHGWPIHEPDFWSSFLLHPDAIKPAAERAWMTGNLSGSGN